MMSIFRRALLALVLAVGVIAQIDAGQIPQACLSPCQKLLDLANTCIVEYPAQGMMPTATACLCSGINTLDSSSCNTCLTSNSPSLAQSITQLSTFCADFISSCKYECSFDTCDSANVQCQCEEPYLQKIYNCASCNSAHGNANATMLADYNALHNSCTNQGHTSAPTGADPIPTPSGTISYTGGGITLASVSSAVLSTSSAHVVAGTSSHASASTGMTTTGTGSTNTGTTATILGANPSILTGRAVKTKVSMFQNGWTLVALSVLVMMLVGEVV